MHFQIAVVFLKMSNFVKQIMTYFDMYYNDYNYQQILNKNFEATWWTKSELSKPKHISHRLFIYTNDLFMVS